MSSYRTKVYPETGKPCWVLVYSALLVALFSGITFEDVFAGVIALPPGWSVEWVASPTNANSIYWCLVRVSSWHRFNVSYRVLFFHCNNELWWTVLDKTSIALVLILDLVCNNFKFPLQDSVMYEMRVVVLSGLAFVWGLLIRSQFFCGFNRDFTRGTAEVRASWIRVAFATMVSALIQFILGGSATAGIRAK